MNKALFLDRDGILNVDKGYVYQWSEIVWIDEVFEMIKTARDRGYLVIILTNQSGICRGKYTEADVEVLHKQMSEYLVKKGTPVTDWFYCADMDSELRKPRPGMLLAAQKKHNIDLSKSFMVGDKATDIFETDGSFTRPTTFLVKGGYDLKESHLEKGVKVFETHKDVLKELLHAL